MWTLEETVGAGTVDARALGEAAPGKQPPLLSLGERLLSSVFRASCQAMKAAAQFCGMASGEDARRVGIAWGEWAQLDLQALLLSGPLPLSEIAAAYRERK